MRISDWSSDVCSSDLTPFIQRWGAIAAALVVGLFAGQLVDMPGGGGNLVKGSDGNLVASGKLAAALDSQLASDNPQALGSPVRIGLTFVGGAVVIAGHSRRCERTASPESPAGGTANGGFA